jgi:predicted dehydrogenase
MNETNETPVSRRRFLMKSSAAALAAGLAAQSNTSSVFAQDDKNKPPKADTQKPIKLPPFQAETERKSEPPMPMAPEERVGFALLGLGRLSVEQLLPAFQQTKKAKAVALVSGSPEKARQLAAQYGIAEKNIYDYKTYDRLKDNAEVKAIYVVLPNGMHLEYVVRGAAAGKHILCEKPMANTAKECEEMIAACKKADRKLMVAYRIQYEPHNRRVREIIKSGDFGKVKLIEAVNGQRQGDPNQWRHKLKLAGGGALPDIGLYCLNTARFLLGEEPSEITAVEYTTPNDPRFREVEENMLFQMKFPSGVLVNNSTGYDFHDSKRYRVNLQTGWIEMAPAYSYQGLELKTSRADGEMERTEQIKLPQKNQFALEIDHFAECILENKQPFSPGEEGLQDHRIMEKIYEAARAGKTVKLSSEIQNAKIPRGAEPKS